MAGTLNTGYGQLEANALASNGQAGRTFVVSSTSNPMYNDLITRFVQGPDGFVRFSTTIGAALTQINTSLGNGGGDTIYIAPGTYDEVVVLTRGVHDGVRLVGLGGWGAVSIAPSGAGAIGLTNGASDVTLVNIDVAGDDTAIYGTFNTGSRLRAFNCKFEANSGSGASFGMGPGTAAQVAAHTAGNCGDILLVDCEFCWATDGIDFVATDYGTPTQISIIRPRVHNISGTEFLGVPGAFGVGSVRNLELIDGVWDAMEDGTKPSDFININDASDTGIVSGNRIRLATNASADLKVGAKILWVANATEAGWSTARPA